MKILIITLLFLSGAKASEETILFASTKSMSPYVNHYDKSGIEYEIIRDSFLAAGYDDFQHIDIHFKRGILLLKKKSIDAISTNFSNKSYDNIGLPIYSSETTLNYIDCAISLKNNNYDLSSISNFYKKRVWGFKSASVSLGKEFEVMAKANPDYTEGFSQENQAKVLINKRIDIAISDKNIFLSSLSESNLESSKGLFSFQPIGSPTKRTVRFHDRKLRDDFNKGLQKIKKDGSYEQILLKYKDLYSNSCD